ncbi:MAG: MucB/RseB C-terminal domain-containing protein [Gemmatimonadota bacterium]
MQFGRAAAPTDRYEAMVARGVLRALLLILLACAGFAQAQSHPAQGRKADPRQDPPRTELQWLQAIQAAAERLNYSGTIIYQQGEEVRASRLVHVFDGHESRERLQPLDGQLREFIRRADEVQCLMPESRQVVIERRLAQDAFPAITSADPAEILQHYTVRLGGTERVAGVECQVINIEPKDRMRYGYRLWVDRSSGLLLRAITLNDRNEVLEQMAFAEVQTGAKVDRAQLKPSWSTDGWRVERTQQSAIDLAQQGWHVTPPAGFHKLHEVARSLWGSTAERKVMQAVFTDGLASVSVFIEPSPTDSMADAAQSKGPTSVYARRMANARVTVVGEVPMSTVKSVAKSIEFRPPR